MSDERIILPGSVGWLPNDNPRKESNWKCWELPGQWLSWCQKIVDLDEMVPHTRGCAICTEFLKRLSSKVELYGNDET